MQIESALCLPLKRLLFQHKDTASTTAISFHCQQSAYQNSPKVAICIDYIALTGIGNGSRAPNHCNMHVSYLVRVMYKVLNFAALHVHLPSGGSQRLQRKRSRRASEAVLVFMDGEVSPGNQALPHPQRRHLLVLLCLCH